MAELSTGHPAVFHHVPRCGGTSVARAFRARYALSQVALNARAAARVAAHNRSNLDDETALAETRRFRDELLLYFLHSNVKWISGHMRFSPSAYEQFHDRYRFITVLRDPVQRYLSDYGKNFGKETATATSLPLGAYLDTVQGQSRGCVFTEYFSGLPADADFRTDEAIELALEHLTKFDVVGYTDDMSQFGKSVSKALGVRVMVGHENKRSNADVQQSSQLSDAEMQKLHAVCASDIRVYEAMRETLRARSAAG
ncbi:MAG: sulfotransferase family 2 domain-containing protein [Pseudomonadota bacterium]